MLKMTKKILVVSMLLSITFSALADRGIGKKSKNKVMLNISTQNLKTSIPFNLKSGLRYTGSLLSSRQFSNQSVSNTLVTFQKGNTVYIIPYKQKVLIPEIRQGYTGMKLVIKSH